MGAKDWGPDVDGKKWTPQEISAQILGKLKRDAEAYLGDSVNQAVVTVPAYFDDSAHGHQGGRTDRGARGTPDHQRADGGGARVRPRQAA